MRNRKRYPKVQVTEIDGLRFQMKRLGNDTYYATLIQDSQQRALVRHYHSNQEYDDTGALYYVIAVVLIYGLSIVLMIASHIKKNKLDGHISIYLKEIAFVRKQTRRDQLLVRVGSQSLQDRSPRDGNSSPTLDYSTTTTFPDNLSCTSRNDSESPRELTPGCTVLAIKEPGTRFPFNTPQQPSTHVRFEDERQRLLVPRTPSPTSRHPRHTRPIPTSPIPAHPRRNSRLTASERRRSIAEKRDALAPLILRNPRINIENSSDDSEGVVT